MKAILTYHSIDESGSPISMPAAVFARHVRFLASGRVRVTTVDELLRLPDDTDAVAITFDDGFANFGALAAPLLAEHGLASTVFVVTDHVGGTNEWGGFGDPGVPILPLLDWDDLGRLCELKVSLGSHTRTHPRLALLGPEELRDEIVHGARFLFEHTGRQPAGFAYPYGSTSPAAAAVVRATFPWACTTELRSIAGTDDQACLPRLDMFYFREPGRLESWGTTRFSCYLKIRSHARRLRQRWALETAS